MEMRHLRPWYSTVCYDLYRLPNLMRVWLLLSLPCRADNNNVPLAVCADDAYPHSKAMRDKLSLANISYKSSLAMAGIFTLNYIISATCSLPLRGLIIVGLRFTLCVQVQGLGFNHLRA